MTTTKFDPLKFMATHINEWVTPTQMGQAARPGKAYKISGKGSAILKPLLKAGLVEKHSMKGWYRLTRYGRSKAEGES